MMPAGRQGRGTALVAALRATPPPRVAAVLVPVAGGRAGRGWLCAESGRGRLRRGKALTFLQQAQLPRAPYREQGSPSCGRRWPGRGAVQDTLCGLDFFCYCPFAVSSPCRNRDREDREDRLVQGAPGGESSGGA